MRSGRLHQCISEITSAPAQPGGFDCTRQLGGFDRPAHPPLWTVASPGSGVQKELKLKSPLAAHWPLPNQVAHRLITHDYRLRSSCSERKRGIGRFFYFLLAKAAIKPSSLSAVNCKARLDVGFQTRHLRIDCLSWCPKTASYRGGIRLCLPVHCKPFASGTRETVHSVGPLC